MIELLEELRGRFERLAGMAEETAKEAAPLVEAELRSTAAAGTSPDGTAWPAKRDGGRPMLHAASHITARSFGRTVRATLEGPDVFWHFREGKFSRPVLPDSGTIPAGIARALKTAADRAFARLTR